MADFFWIGTTDTDPTDTNNWSDSSGGSTPATGIPGTGDNATFDGAGLGDEPCTMTANLALANLVMQAGYTKKFDGATHNLTMDDGGDVTLAQAGEFDMGTGTLAITNGTFDYSAVGTIVRGSSILTFTGTCDWIAKGLYPNRIANVQILSGMTTLPAGAPGETWMEGSLTIVATATLSVSAGKILANNKNLITGANSFLSGDGTFFMSLVGTTDGYTSRGANTTIDIATFIFRPAPTSPVLVSGDYSGTSFKFLVDSATNALLNTLSGTYTFDDIKLETTAAGTLTIDNSGNDPDFIITGDVVHDQQSSGTIIWTPGTGDMTLSGAADQSVDFGDQTIENVTIDKEAGTLTLDAGFTTDSFTGTAGTFDPASQTIAVDGDMDWAAAFDFTAADNTMDGSAWTVGGNFTADGQTLNATAPWTLDITGTSIISGVGSVEYCDASGSALEIVALGWTDGEDNANWIFELFGDWVLAAATEQEILAADEYRDNLLIQLQSQVASGVYPVYLAFGTDAVSGEGVSLLGVGDTVVVKGPKARGTISAISAAGASGGVEVGGSIEYKHVRNYA